VVGHALVAAAEDQRLEELVEHDRAADPGAMAAERMLIDPLRQQGMELVPQGSVIQDGSIGTAVCGSGPQQPGFSALCLPTFHPPTAGRS
jgi:hypothetical protein